MSDLHERLANARAHFDLTDPAHQESVVRLAEDLLAEGGEAAGDGGGFPARDPSLPLEARMAGLLAESRRRLTASDVPVRIGVVFAMWGEHHRLLPRSDDNPHGEDSLATKLSQLAWATEDTAVDWRLYAVDDGCPHGSEAIARGVAASHPLGERVCVLALEDHLPAGRGPLQRLASADDSRKGGAILLGALRAIEDGADAVIYTDADNSVHLGQIGLLVSRFRDEARRVVLGSRKHPDSVLVKEAARWGIGIKALRHMQRMIGAAIFSRGILDTQAAFKLYEADLLRDIIADPTVFDFSFDTDWILAALARGERIDQVPFAFIDSAAESASITQGPMTTWETLLFGLIAAVTRHGFRTGSADAMASVVEEEIDGHHDLERLIDRLPAELEEAGESDFGDPSVMSPERLRDWIRQVKGSRVLP